MDGIEYALWHAVHNGPAKYYWLEISDEQIAELSKLSNRIDGWVCHEDGFGVVFVDKEEWVKMYAEYIGQYESNIN